MERYIVYPGPDGHVTITDSTTGRSVSVPAPKGARSQSKPVRVAGYTPLASALVYAVEAA